MHQRRLLLIGFAAIAIAGVFSFLFYRTTLSHALHGTQPMSKVVVAARDLPVGSMLADADLKLVDYPSSSLPAGALSDAAKASGRGVISAMKANELVLDSKLAAENAGAGLPSMIPPNMRAVSVQVNEVIAVAGFVIPGTHVDVLLTGTPEGSKNPNDAMTTTVLDNVEVLAAGQQIQPNAEGKPEKVPVITLLVSPEDAQKLTLASAQGKIQLSLRNPLDTKEELPNAVRNVALYHLPAPAAPAPQHRVAAAPAQIAVAPPPPIYQVETIRGNKRETSKFE
jgi:pilus assembly protein CpaB